MQQGDANALVRHLQTRVVERLLSVRLKDGDEGIRWATDPQSVEV